MVLFVMKDLASFNGLFPVVSQLIQKEVAVHVVAEGMSYARWQTCGLPADKFNLWRFSISDLHPRDKVCVDSAAVLRYWESSFRIADLIKAVILGCGTSNNLEKAFGVRANAADVPVVAFSDTWGAYNRLGEVTLHTVMSIDALERDESLDRAVPEWLSKTLFVNTGDPSWDNLPASVADPLLPYSCVLGLAKTLSPSRTIVVSGQNEVTTGALTFVVESLRLAGQSSRYCILFKPHPKFAEGELGQEWKRILQKHASDGGVYHIFGKEMPMEALLAAVVPRDGSPAGTVVSGYSNTLREAAILGILPVSVIALGMESVMAADLGGRTVFPLSQMGACVNAGEPSDDLWWLDLDNSRRQEIIERGKRIYLSSGNTDRAVRAIERLLVQP